MTAPLDKATELEQLRERVSQLEAEVERESAPEWQPPRFYTAYYATTGFLLGGFGAATSLLFNVVGAALVGKYPLELIRVYLTFPLGEKARQIESGMTLAIGCCLYLGTGMLLGMLFQLTLARFAPRATLGKRLAVASVLALGVWIVNFYLLLSWLQPLLFGGNWIVQEIPVWVAALTHLVFGWTMAVVYPLGEFRPYRVDTEQA
jgi:hypothetical protein